MCITVDKENERLSLSLSKYYEPKILMAVCGQFHVGDLGAFFKRMHTLKQMVIVYLSAAQLLLYYLDKISFLERSNKLA